MTKNEHKYLDYQMKKVSRSFALVVSTVEESFKAQLATAYLICRVVDNIEDCTEPHEWQSKRFSEFNTLLDEPAQATGILAYWSQEAWPGLTDDERHLMSDRGGLTLWQIYQGFAPEVQAIIRRWCLVMAEGMNKIEDPLSPPLLAQRAGIRLLTSESDYNEYCYYVAGTVGHLATELATRFYGFSDATAAQLDNSCEACGRGLQKTNIIKDFREDINRGMSYLPQEWHAEVDYEPISLAGAPLPWKYKVIADVFKDLRDATDYLLALPYSAVGYRIASLLCLLPAYQTLLQAVERRHELFTNQHHIKISRLTMSRCMRDAHKLVNDNDGILAYRGRVEALFSQYFSELRVV